MIGRGCDGLWAILVARITSCMRARRRGCWSNVFQPSDVGPPHPVRDSLDERFIDLCRKLYSLAGRFAGGVGFDGCRLFRSPLALFGAHDGSRYQMAVVEQLLERAAYRVLQEDAGYERVVAWLAFLDGGVNVISCHAEQVEDGVVDGVAKYIAEYIAVGAIRRGRP